MRPILLLLLLIPMSVCAQHETDWEQALREVVGEEDIDSEQWEQMTDLLTDYAEHPIDLNHATREELEALPFLTAQQVEEIMAYLYRYGEMQSLGELQMITSLDYRQRQLLLNFIYLGHEQPKQTLPRLDSIARWGKHELTASLHVPLYDRKGDKNGYLGYKYKHWFRYQFRYSDRIRLGLLGTQDSGEPFFAERNHLGYDHYAYYVMVNRMGILESMVLGQYRLTAGMGLTINTNVSFGKQSVLQNLGRSSNVIRPNTSRMEEGYMQGVAATIRVAQPLTLTAWLSCRPMDATLNDDQTAATLLTTGYHRTPTEMEKKHNLWVTDAGVHLGYRKGSWHAGLTAAYTHLSRDLKPNTKTLYRRYYPQGNDFLNASVDYGYTNYRLSFSGETAIDRHGAVATVNSLSYRFSTELSLMALYRYYSYRYLSLRAQGFAEGTRTQNESGFYMGVDWLPSRRLQLTAYSDVSYAPWAKYQVSLSSYSWDNLITLSYNTGPWTLRGRYRLHLRQRDGVKKNTLLWRKENRGRVDATYTMPSGLALHTQVDASLVDYKTRDYGYMLSGRLSYGWSGVKVDAGAGYFNTSSYESRLYVYERATLYTFSFPMFYGEGMRAWLLARADLGKHWTVLAKAGWTNYFDRATISSGTQLINHSGITDIDIQLRWKW